MSKGNLVGQKDASLGKQNQNRNEVPFSLWARVVAAKKKMPRHGHALCEEGGAGI